MKKNILKKITNSMVTMSVILSFVTTAYASEDLIASPQSFASDTIITEENIAEVLEYVGLSDDSCIFGDVENNNVVYTVGELEDAIKEISEIENSICFSSDDNLRDSKIIGFTGDSRYATNKASSGSKTVTNTVSYGKKDSFSIKYRATGKYSGSKWTGTGSASATVSSNSALSSYEISDEEHDLTYTSDCLTLESNLTVDSYVSVGDYAIIHVSTMEIDATNYFYASDYL